MFLPKKDFEFNLLNIENYNLHPRMNFFKNFFQQNSKINGDYFEFGVFKGSSLISVALLFKKFGIKKKVYGFDSFEGFPSYHKYDDFKNFKKLFKKKSISISHYKDIKSFSNIKRFLAKIEKKNNFFNPKSISSSKDFSDNSYLNLKRKIKFLNLDNISLIKGNFEKTVPNFFKKNPHQKIFTANIDCDLYNSYKIVLDYSWERLSNKGIIYLDEYYSLKFPGAKIATDLFLKKNKIKLKKIKTWKTDFERWYIKK